MDCYGCSSKMILIDFMEASEEVPLTHWYECPVCKSTGKLEYDENGRSKLSVWERKRKDK